MNMDLIFCHVANMVLRNLCVCVFGVGFITQFGAYSAGVLRSDRESTAGVLASNNSGNNSSPQILT